MREAKELDLYAVEVRGIKGTLKISKEPVGRMQQPKQPSSDDQPASKELSARRLKEQERSRARKDAFHAKKRAEAAAATAYTPRSIQEECRGSR